MAYLGHRPAVGENNTFRILDDIKSYTLTFDASSSGVVSTTDNVITSQGHRFITGQRVTYTHGGGTAIGNLANDGVYFIIKSDKNTFGLAANANDAATGTAINLNALGVGDSHTLNAAFDGVNTRFRATFNNGEDANITRAAQLSISVNGVVQQPQQTATPTEGFGVDVDNVIVFSAAPVASDAYWAYAAASNVVSFDITDNRVDNFTGDNTTVSFTLSDVPANNDNVLVTIDGVVQYPSTNTVSRAYSVSENVLTFTAAPGLGAAIQVRHIGFAGSVSGNSVTGFYGRTGNVVLADSDQLRGDGSLITNLSAGKFTDDNAGIHTLTSVGVNTTGLEANTGLTGVGNTFQGMYISNGMMIMDNALHGNHYIGTAFNGLMAGPVNITGVLTIDGNYVVV